MARGTVLTEDAKRLIDEFYIKHPDWRANKIQRGVIKRLHREKLYVEPNWPGLSAVKKRMTKIKERKKQVQEADSLEDKPWTLGSLNKSEYELPAEALPAVFKAWGYYQEHKIDTLPLRERKPFSNRLAKWVSRLYTVTDNIKKLTGMAYELSRSEQLAELTGTDLEESGDITLLHLQIYEMVSGEKDILYNEDRLLKFCFGLYLPKRFLSKANRARLKDTREDDYDEAFKRLWKELKRQYPDKKDFEEALNLKESLAKLGKYTEEVRHERSHNQEVQE